MGTSKIDSGILIGVLFCGLFFFAVSVLRAEDVQEDSASKNIGGLLFDFDEGVEIEEGPGGSVYVRSNKEFMKKRLRGIDRRIDTLEERIVFLEDKLSEISAVAGAISGPKTSIESSNQVGQTADGRRVLST